MVGSHLHEFQLEISQVQTFFGKIGLCPDRIIMAHQLPRCRSSRGRRMPLLCGGWRRCRARPGAGSSSSGPPQPFSRVGVRGGALYQPSQYRVSHTHLLFRGQSMQHGDIFISNLYSCNNICGLCQLRMNVWVWGRYEECAESCPLCVSSLGHVNV